MRHCRRRLLVLAGGIALLSARPVAAQNENAPKWKFDAGVSVSPLFKAYLDEPSCCTPLGGWMTVGSGRFRLQVDYARNEREQLSYADYYEEHMGEEIVVERALPRYQRGAGRGRGGVLALVQKPTVDPASAFWPGAMASGGPPLRRRGIAEHRDAAVRQRFRVDFSGGRPCAGEPFLTRVNIRPQVGAGIDYALNSRIFARVQLRLLEVRVGAGIRF